MIGPIPSYPNISNDHYSVTKTNKCRHYTACETTSSPEAKWWPTLQNAWTWLHQRSFSWRCQTAAKQHIKSSMLRLDASAIMQHICPAQVLQYD